MSDGSGARLESERLLEAFTIGFPDLGFVVSADGTFLEVIAGDEEMLYAEPETVIGASIHDVFPEGKADEFVDVIQAAVESGTAQEHEYTLTIKGETHWYEARADALPFRIDGAEVVVWVSRDITERKHTEQALERYRSRLTLALDAANAGTWQWDIETDESDWDTHLERLYGLEPGDYGGSIEDFLSRIHPDDRASVEAALDRAVEKVEPFENRFRIVRESDDEIRWLASRGRILTDDQGEPSGMLGIAIDITELKKAEERASRRTQQLEALNRVVRHDIRNDMTVIIGWAEFLADHVDPAGLDYLEKIRSTGDHIVELTEIARDYIETLTGDGAIHVEPTGFRSILTTELSLRRESHDHAEFVVDGRIPDVEVSGNELLSSVFRNLLNNAVQHNDAETPRVTVSCDTLDDGLEIRFADNGPGVPEDRRESIFGKGEKGLDSPGTGLGLYLSRVLVESYGGSIRIEDNEPRGSVFVVELPLVDSS